MSRRRLPSKASGSPYSPERALEIACHIHLRQVRIAGQGAASGLTELTPEQLALFEQLQLDTPDNKDLRHRRVVSIFFSGARYCGVNPPPACQ